MSSAAELFGEIERAGLFLDNSWKVKQNDQLDRRTAHIYQCRSLDELREKAEEKKLSEHEKLYALHRWRNFKRHDAWQALLFEQVPLISLPEKEFHKQQDFLISSDGEDIPFDLKITRYPNTARQGLSDRELAEWFYENQSQQGRFHRANRFFVVGEPERALYDIDLARRTVADFVQNTSKFRHFINHPDGQTSQAVILRQRQLPITQ
jgi:hypothetical protein